MKQKNPFFLKDYTVDEPFCDRSEEQKALAFHARALDHVVLFSPRRTGKTSLIKKVQKTLAQEGAVCIYVDFFGVSSVEEIAARLAQAVFEETHSRETLFKKAVSALQCFRPTVESSLYRGNRFTVGVQLISNQLSGLTLLEDVLMSLGKFIREIPELVHFTLDEFQEVTTLAQADQIQILLHDYIHRHAAAYTFIGSRRTALRSMFAVESRPSFQEVIFFELPPIPVKTFADFITQQFSSQGKIFEPKIATQLVSAVACFPYYSRKLACHIFEHSENEVTTDDVEKGLLVLIKYEEPFFEGIFLGLAPGQIALLRAIAREPSKSIFAQEFIQRHRIGSIGGAQGAKKKMLNLDIIEFREQKWRVVDPVFEKWLVRNKMDFC